MTLKRAIFFFLIPAIALVLVAIAALSCFFLFVPQYIESTVIPDIARDNGIYITSLKIRNIGIRGIEISDVRIKGQKENLTIDSIRIDYSLSGLLDRQVERIALSGLSLNLEYEKNRISMGSLDGFLKNAGDSTEKDNVTSAPFTIKELLISNSIIHLKVNKKSLSVPFDFAATSFNQYMLPEKFKLEIYPGGHEIAVQGNVDTNKKIKIALTANDLSLGVFEIIINEIIPLDLKGQVDIQLSADISTEPFYISDIIAFCRLQETIIDYPGITIKSSANSNNSEQPIIIQVESKDLNHWEFDVSHLLLDAKPIPIILDISGSADLSEDAQRGNIKAISQIMTDDNPPQINWDISVDRESRSDNFKVVINGKPNITGKKAIPIKADFDDMLFTVFSPELNIQAEYNRGFLSGSYLLKIKNIESAYNEMSFSMPMFSIKGDFDQLEGRTKRYISNFFMESKGIVSEGFDITMNIPDYQIKGTMQCDMEKVINTNAMVSFKNGSLSILGDLLKVNKVSGNIPLYWPLSESTRKGKLSIEKITYENYSLGPVNIDIVQKGKDIPFSGAVTFPALPEMIISLSGNTTIEPMLEEVKMNIEIPSYNPTSKIDLGRFSPLLNGFFYKGNLKSKAGINLSDSGLLSELNFEINNGTIENSENDLSLEDISLNLKLDDLVSIKSSFGQRLKVARISFGDIQANNFILDFKVDGPSSLFVEKGSFKWCGGHINIQSFRVNPEKEEYDLTLFCDRLKLAEILAQFGVVNASGGGTVNGKLPIKISKNKISFQDGFLYSTPGGGGKINIAETDILTVGLDPNSAEYAQMDIAREALKAFDYTWVKMSLESEKDELVLRLQFDGKPENRLPFRYSKDAGKFIRVENSAEGSDFEGISLDVNFRIPFDRILNIKDVLDMM